MRSPPEATAETDAAAAGAAPYLLICPTHRDLRELTHLGLGPDQVLTHIYASEALERMAGAATGGTEAVSDPLVEIDAILRKYRGQALAGVISADDYPGSTIASVVARRRGLAGPDPAVNLLLQHKYHARAAQHRFTPEATPAFALLDPVRPDIAPLDYPFFLKPVKSFFSIGAQPVSSAGQLHAIRSFWDSKGAFFAPFERLLSRYSALPMAGHLLAEGLLHGHQVTLEGYAHGDEIGILGVVDSIFTPGTLAFERFDYPSAAPAEIQARMGEIARRLMTGVGFRDGLFNIEFIYDLERDTVDIIEVNPRIASQFADLYEKVDGYNSYQVLLDLAAGRQPRPTRGAGPHAFAASCVLRTFSDALVVRVPNEDDVERLQQSYPGARVEVLATEGRALSEEMQDGHSYRYGVINLGGRDLADVTQQLTGCRSLLDFQFAPSAELRSHADARQARR